jgi:hypothetical protein
MEPSKDCFEFLEELNLSNHGALNALKAAVLNLDKRLVVVSQALETLEARQRRDHEQRPRGLW